MKFTVNTGNPNFSNNSLKSGNRLATYRQTQQEHDDLLDISNLPDYPYYMAMPEGPEKEEFKNYLVVQAIQREKDDPKYWDDEEPRKPISQSSSWVGDIDFNPETNLITIALGNKGTTKTIYGTADDAAEWVNAQSIGQKANKDLLDHRIKKVKI